MKVKITIKYIFILLARWILMALRVLPIKKRRILFYSFAGKQYSDSPRYVAEYIETVRPERYEIVWALKDINDQNVPRQTNWKVIKYKSIQFILYYITSSVIVTNLGPIRCIKRRKKQVIINTWHGGGAYKKDGMSNPYKSKMEVCYNKIAMRDVSVFLSSSRAFRISCIEDGYGYYGEVLECGLPRNDILLNQSIHESTKHRVHDYYKLSHDTYVVLFAPTWRNYSMDSYEKLNYGILLENLVDKFGGEWVVIYRAHSLTKDCVDARGIIDGTSYPDMQELLITADLLITDYSSSIWDYSLMNKFALLFTPDLNQYESVFGFSTPIETWGYEVCRSNNDISKAITAYNPDKLSERIECNHKFYGITESGIACEKVLKYIESSR